MNLQYVLVKASMSYKLLTDCTTGFENNVVGMFALANFRRSLPNGSILE